MATLYRPNGTTAEITPKNGRDFTLEELREIVDCRWIEVVHLRTQQGPFFVVDEEGKMFDKPRNEAATRVYGNPFDYIVGNALLCKRGEVR